MKYNINIPDRPECQTCSLMFAYNEIELLYDIAVMLTGTTNVADTIERGMRLLKRHSYLDRCALFILGDDKETLELYASIDLSEQQKQMATYKLGEGATGLAAQSAEPVVIENVHNNINYLNKLGNVTAQSIAYADRKSVV